MPPPSMALVLKRLELAEEIRAKLDAGKAVPRMKTLKAFGVRITPKLKKRIQSANRFDRLIRAMQAHGMDLPEIVAQLRPAVVEFLREKDERWREGRRRGGLHPNTRSGVTARKIAETVKTRPRRSNGQFRSWAEIDLQRFAYSPCRKEPKRARVDPIEAAQRRLETAKARRAHQKRPA